MTELDVNALIFLITFFVIFGVFLFFDLFRREENYAFLAYVVAVLPVNFMWVLGYDTIFIYLLLMGLWDLCLFRDLLFVYRKTKEYDNILLFLMLGLLVQLIVSAILPEIVTNAQTNAFEFWVFYLPDIHGATGVESSIILGFQGITTLTFFLVIIPMLLDVKGEEVPFPILLIIVAIYIIPFLVLSLIWLPEAWLVLTFLFSVILFILLLIITKSGKETPQ